MKGNHLIMIIKIVSLIAVSAAPSFFRLYIAFIAYHKSTVWMRHYTFSFRFKWQVVPVWNLSKRIKHMD